MLDTRRSLRKTDVQVFTDRVSWAEELDPMASLPTSVPSPSVVVEVKTLMAQAIEAMTTISKTKFYHLPTRLLQPMLSHSTGRPPFLAAVFIH